MKKCLRVWSRGLSLFSLHVVQHFFWSACHGWLSIYRSLHLPWVVCICSTSVCGVSHLWIMVVRCLTSPWPLVLDTLRSVTTAHELHISGYLTAQKLDLRVVYALASIEIPCDIGYRYQIYINWSCIRDTLLSTISGNWEKMAVRSEINRWFLIYIFGWLVDFFL